MILEGLVTSRNADGSPHFAPMGPIVEPDFTRLILRPFNTSATYRNLRDHPYGVFHITDDAALIARAAIGRAEMPAYRTAEAVSGFVLTDACRAYEFAIHAIDESRERVEMRAEVRCSHSLRDFLGFQRAKHALLEAAILATRRHLITRDEILAEYRKLRVIVEKTGDSAELDAMHLLERYIEE